MIDVGGIAAVMNEMGGKLALIPGLTVKPFNALSVVPPAAIVEVPGDFNYHTEYGAGAYSAKTRIHVVVGRLDDVSSRDNLVKYFDTAGPYSVFARIDSSVSNTYGTCHDVTIKGADTVPFEVAGVDYLDALFEVEFIGRGLQT